MIDSPEKAKEAIEAWIKEDKSMIDEKHNEKFHFYFVVSNPSDPEKYYEIFQAKDTRDNVIVGFQILMGEKIKSLYQQLPKIKRDGFIRDFKYLLLLKDVHYEILTLEDEPEAIVLSHKIYYDGLTKDRLKEYMDRILNAFILVNVKLTEYFGNVDDLSMPQSPMYM